MAALVSHRTGSADVIGWQPRYFVLDSGILSYYDSQDDVGKGSKGSIKMAVCEIKVHPTDPTRMELVIPGEQYFYLKAGGAAERQKWLVALGSSKACLGDSRSQKDKAMHLSSESLGRKLSELRLYCDVLTQQVLDVQESTRPQDNGSPLDIEMNEASSLLRATCSQFISTLEECMKFANARLAPELYQPSPSPLPQDFVGTKLPHSQRVRRSLSHTGIVSPDRGAEPPRPPVPPQKGAVTVVRNLEEMVMFRSQHWSQQGPAPDSPVGTIVEEREGRSHGAASLPPGGPAQCSMVTWPALAAGCLSHCR
ncbi:pleckstrin homology domain-containing family A member 3-like isoform X2 [Mauremys mutica]|uniref:pleckstrin homology domain-containing family A member 3-like isoform X2 n=1 Tax=Mauremys mutica TaxID=74926 RepID=UPI001D163883|nr:pleckstrin homology domain-containing family A member 3-like isoform X2 [Mauremys mutica]